VQEAGEGARSETEDFCLYASRYAGHLTAAFCIP
jgi:hypothetical protein